MAIIELSKNELADVSGGSGIHAPISTIFSAIYAIPKWFGDIKDKLFGIFSNQAKERQSNATHAMEGQLACSYTAEKK